jgi:hypothetical protein
VARQHHGFIFAEAPQVLQRSFKFVAAFFQYQKLHLNPRSESRPSKDVNW